MQNDDDDIILDPNSKFKNKSVTYILPGEGAQLKFELDEPSKQKETTSQNYLMSIEYADGHVEEIGLIYSELQVEKLAYFLSSCLGSRVLEY